MRTRLPRVAAGLVVLALLTIGLGAAPPVRAQSSAKWTVVTLKPLNAGEQTVVTDVNDKGYAVGMSGASPVLWAPNGTPTLLPTKPGTPNARPTAINDNGIVVGSSGWPAPDPGREAVAWVYSTIVSVAAAGDALDISDANIVAGCRADKKPFVSQLEQAPLTLPTDAATPFGCARSINTWGAVGGFQRSDASPTVTHARLWFDGVAYDWDGTPQHVSEVTKVTESGYVLLRIAAKGTPASPTHSAVSGPGGAYSLFDPAAAGSFAADLNNKGAAVGSRATSGNGSGSGTFDEPVMWLYGSTVPIATLVANADISKVATGSPVALSDTFAVVGNTGTASWLLRPPA